MMLRAALRDLQHRRRRFVVAALGTSLVFAITLVLTGLSNGFDTEARQTVGKFGADAWVVQGEAPGPFLGATPIPESAVDEVADLPGVEAAGPFVFGRQTYDGGGGLEDINVFGADPGSPGMPTATEGRAPAAPGELMVSTALGPKVGDTLSFVGLDFEVVGRVSNFTALAGVANTVFLTADAQAVAYSGAPLISAVATTGTPEAVPADLALTDNDGALDDITRPIDQAKSTITFLAVLLWVVAALIIGSVVYLSALERLRDFAVFKAVGVSTSGMIGGLVAQATLLAVVAALIGSVLGVLIAPIFPMRTDIPASAFALLPAVAVVVGAVASTIGMRRVISVDPALAFD